MPLGREKAQQFLRGNARAFEEYPLQTFPVHIFPAYHRSPDPPAMRSKNTGAGTIRSDK
jgi:hypothetical protein